MTDTIQKTTEQIGGRIAEQTTLSKGIALILEGALKESCQIRAGYRWLVNVDENEPNVLHVFMSLDHETEVQDVFHSFLELPEADWNLDLTSVLKAFVSEVQQNSKDMVDVV